MRGNLPECFRFSERRRRVLNSELYHHILRCAQDYEEDKPISSEIRQDRLLKLRDAIYRMHNETLFNPRTCFLERVFYGEL